MKNFKNSRLLPKKKECRHEIKILQIDRGELLSNDFEDFCKKHRIHKQVTVRKTLNVVAERKNRTMVKMARSMLSEKRLSNEFRLRRVYLHSSS